MSHHSVLAVFLFPRHSAFSLNAEAQPRSKIVIGYASMSSVVTTLRIAQENYFAKNGLDVQSIFIPVPTLIATTTLQRRAFGLHRRHGNTGSRGRRTRSENRRVLW